MARERTPEQLVSQTAEDMAQRLNAKVHTTCKVQSIQPEAHRVVSDQGEITYSKLVLATGANPIALPLAGDGAEDVLSVNSLSDYRVFCKRLDQLSGKRIGIIGNGLVGCEFANELAAKGYQVTVIGLTNWPLDPVMPEQVGRDLQDKLSAMGVQWHLGNSVQSVNKAGVAYGLTLQGGEQLEVDLVLSAVGLRPRTELAAAAGINCQRGIVVDGQLQTSAQDVYALGDCTELDGQVLPYIAPITHGLKALAANVLGQSVAVDYPLMPVVVKTPALPLLLQPPARDQEGEWHVDVLDDGMRALFRDSQQQVRGFALSGGVQQRERQQWLDAIRDAG